MLVVTVRNAAIKVERLRIEWGVDVVDMQYAFLINEEKLLWLLHVMNPGVC